MSDQFNKMNWPQDIIDRFWSKVNFPEDIDDCWEWNGGLTIRGYGDFTRNGMHLRAHRCSYEYYYGPILNNMHVLHKCDNRKCVNPNHLFLGNQTDNTNDMLMKKRQAVGSKIAISTMSESQVEQILEGIKIGKFNSRKQIVESFKITYDTLDYFLRKGGWSHITQKYSNNELENMRRSLNLTSKLTKLEIKQLKEDLKNGVSIVQLMSKFNVSKSAICYYKYNRNK